MNDLRGIYLVIDPAMNRKNLLPRLRQALEAGIDLLQIWNHWPKDISHNEKLALIDDILKLAKPHQVPVLINEDWQLLKETGLHGVHFDGIPENWKAVKKTMPPNAITGLTVGNDIELIRWAQDQGFRYLSFCAMFPSASVDNCEIVRPDTVLEARKITALPLFLSGGIHPDNLRELAHLDFQGVAIISGIMNADSPRANIEEYRTVLKKLNKTAS